MGMGETLEDLQDDPEDDPDADPAIDGLLQAGSACESLLHDDAALESFLQRDSVQRLEGHVGDAVLFAQFVDRDDVRVIEGGQDLGLALETKGTLRIVAVVGGQYLDGHVAALEKVVAGIAKSSELPSRPAVDVVPADPPEAAHGLFPSWTAPEVGSGR
jgi:hypothetical protein